MRILVSGDSHCNISYMSELFSIAKKMDCTKIFVVGDFGFWPTSRIGFDFLEKTQHMAGNSHIEVYWCDGNHEDFNALEDVYGGLSRTDEFISIRKDIYYAPRGFVWTWDDVKFMSVGGAYSIEYIKLDDGSRLFIRGEGPGQGWFEQQEVLSMSDIERCKTRGKVDVVFAHDVSALVDIFSVMPHLTPDVNSNLHRLAMMDATSQAHPKLYFHGHYHRHYTEQIGPTRFIGLAHDKVRNRKHSWWVLDTQEEFGVEFRESQLQP